MFAQSSKALLDQGWKELTMDNDSAALNLFENACQKAQTEKNQEIKATALLYSGFATYGASLSNGLNYCLRAMDEFKKLESTSSQKALEGRSRCLQLMSTIKSRQGKIDEAMTLSREALAGFVPGNDSTGTLGLIYNSIGSAFEQQENYDSSAYYYQLSLDENLRTHHVNYLPTSYCKVASVQLLKGNKNESLTYYLRALEIGDSSGNKQAQVAALLGLATWYLDQPNEKEAEQCLLRAQQIASSLSDQSFHIKALTQLALFRKNQGRYQESLLLQEKINTLNNNLSNWERQRIVKSLEVQFDVLEKDRKIKLIEKENQLSRITNWFLLSILIFLVIITAAIVTFLRRVSKRDKLLLEANQELAVSTAEQKRLKEQQLQNEIEFKESQLTAMTLQMLQKNELMQELKEKYDQETNQMKDSGVGKIISKAMNQEKDWNDFNAHFESMNKNFYQRLKQSYPDISPNEMKICALIKLNLSIKEMAGILNISPDSVKTARYRLRKKLELNTEDNLTDFILSL